MYGQDRNGYRHVRYKLLRFPLFFGILLADGTSNRETRVSKKASDGQRSYVAKLYPEMAPKRLMKLSRNEAGKLIDKRKHTVAGKPRSKRNEKKWGDSYECASPEDILKQILIDPEGERATDNQVGYLGRLRPDIPAEALPRLSKRQAYNLIEEAKKHPTTGTRGYTSVPSGASGGRQRQFE